jgi:hypothetical protein
MIGLFVANASGATLLSLDDPAVDTDQGVAFNASFTSVATTPQPPEGESKLRRVVQNISISTSATLKLTPIADGNENPSDTQTFSLASTTDGSNPTIEAHAANQGSRFQVRTEVTAHVGVCELGEAEQWTVGKLSSRSSS